jgi:hypothetical protein
MQVGPVTVLSYALKPPLRTDETHALVHLFERGR